MLHEMWRSRLIPAIFAFDTSSKRPIRATGKSSGTGGGYAALFARYESPMVHSAGLIGIHTSLNDIVVHAVLKFLKANEEINWTFKPLQKWINHFLSIFHSLILKSLFEFCRLLLHHTFTNFSCTSTHNMGQPSFSKLWLVWTANAAFCPICGTLKYLISLGLHQQYSNCHWLIFGAAEFLKIASFMQWFHGVHNAES